VVHEYVGLVYVGLLEARLGEIEAGAASLRRAIAMAQAAGTAGRRPDCFDPDRGTGRARLLTIVRNRSLDHLRRRCQQAREDVLDLADRLPDPRAADVLDEFASAARAELLWHLVGALPPCQADLIRCSFISGQTHQGIADATGLPLGTVKSRIRLGLEKLRAGMRSATLADVAG
jgi:RNA polymerase sigma-70 factor (ECF subfamily)